MTPDERYAAEMREEREAFAAFMGALRASGVTHYEGTVPGWGARVVKLIVAPPAPALAAESTAPQPRPFALPGPMTEAELDARVLGHVRRYGGAV